MWNAVIDQNPSHICRHVALLVNASDHLVVLNDKVVGTISISGRDKPLGRSHRVIEA